MKKTGTLTMVKDEPNTTPLYQQMEQMSQELSVRLNELEFAQYVLSSEKEDWVSMGKELTRKIRASTFVSDRKEVDVLLETVIQTIKNYGNRLGEISKYIDEANERFITIKSAIASLDIMDNIDSAIKGGVSTEGFPSLSSENAENELRSIRTLLHSSKALVELRTF